MTLARAPSAVWLLDGGTGHGAALLQGLTRHYPQVEWSAWAQPPGDVAGLALALQTRPWQLVLLASEQASASPAEARWRDWLQQGGWPHAVLYLPAQMPGRPATDPMADSPWCQRLATCVGLVPRQLPAHDTPTRWHGVGCEGCSDPACERRLFQDLLSRRSVQA